jgi:tetratricopeptide (TPR) repeat protein
MKACLFLARPLVLVLFVLVGVRCQQAERVLPESIRPGSPDSIADLRDTARVALVEANALNSSGKYIEAIAGFRRAAKLAPNLFDAQYALGLALFRSGDYATSIEPLQTAANLNADSDAFYYLGMSCYYTKKYEPALYSFRHALKTGRLTSLSYNNMGYALLQLRRLEEAGIAFDAALKLEPNLYDATLGLCAVYVYSNQGQSALNTCSAAVAHLPGSSSAHFLQGQVFFKLGRYAAALRSFRLADQLQPKSARAFVAIGAAYLKLGDPARALENFKHATELNPNLERACIGAGFANFELKDYDSAEQFFLRALEINPRSMEAHFNLAISCLRRGNRGCALRHYNQLKTYNSRIGDRLFKIIFRDRVIEAGSP